MFATEQCLLVLTHHPAVWHQAAQFLDQSAKLLTEKGVRISIGIFIKLLAMTTTSAAALMWQLCVVNFIFKATVRLKIKINSTSAGGTLYNTPKNNCNFI